MRDSILLLSLGQLFLPALAARRVTVEKLEKMLESAHEKPDARVAEELSDLELTERLSAAKLSRLEAGLSGPESRQSLVMLADASAFLDPPAAEILATPSPDLAAQRQILSLTADYATRTVRRLPNFYATEDTIHFEDSPPRQNDSDRTVDGSFIPYVPLHPVSRSSDQVYYRDGQEFLDSDVPRSKKADQSPGLSMSGVFGAILETTLVDASRGNLVWGYWEQGTKGPVATFRFSVPRQDSHYQVELRSIAATGQSSVFHEFSAYHGEITIDPANGTILRLVIIADHSKSDPVVKSEILVEYGPVQIGGETYFCPTRSVAISMAPTQSLKAVQMQSVETMMVEQENAETRPPLQTMLNEVAFRQYHLFRAEARILNR
jgi:hypothetical protein